MAELEERRKKSIVTFLSHGMEFNKACNFDAEKEEKEKKDNEMDPDKTPEPMNSQEEEENLAKEQNENPNMLQDFLEEEEYNAGMGD